VYIARGGGERERDRDVGRAVRETHRKGRGHTVPAGVNM